MLPSDLNLQIKQTNGHNNKNLISKLCCKLNATSNFNIVTQNNVQQAVKCQASLKIDKRFKTSGTIVPKFPSYQHIMMKNLK